MPRDLFAEKQDQKKGPRDLFAERAPTMTPEQAAQQADAMESQAIMRQMQGLPARRPQSEQEAIEGPLTTTKQLEKDTGIADEGLRHRFTFLPIAVDEQGNVVPAAPQAIVDLLKGAEAPGVAARGGEVTIEDVTNLGLGATGGASVAKTQQRALSEAMANRILKQGAGRVAPVADDTAKALAPRTALAGSDEALPPASLEDFQTAKVNPDLASVGGGGTSRLVKGAEANIPGGADVIRSGTDKQIGQAKAARDAIASEFGSGFNEESIAGVVSKGIERFVRDGSAKVGKPTGKGAKVTQTSLRAKQELLYDDVGKKVPKGRIIPMNRTAGELNDIANRFDEDTLNDLFSNPRFKKFREVVAPDGGEPVSLSYRDAREFRTQVRMLSEDEDLARTISQADWSRLRQAMTEDMLEGVSASAGDDVARQLRQADKFTRAAAQRIENTLDDFWGTKNAGQVFSKMKAAAKKGASTQDTQKLLAIKRTLKPEEWNEVASTFIRSLGQQTAGAADDAGFSINTFVKDWNTLSPAARNALFGNAGMKEHVKRLDALARVMGSLKKSLGEVSTSKSGNPALLASAGAGIAAAPMTTLSLILSNRAVANAMMSPRFVTWLTKAGRLARSAQAVTGRAARPNRAWLEHMGRLEAIAADDPAVSEIIRALSSRAEEQETQRFQPSI